SESRRERARRPRTRRPVPARTRNFPANGFAVKRCMMRITLSFLLLASFSTLNRAGKGPCSCRPQGKVYTPNPKRSSANALETSCPLSGRLASEGTNCHSTHFKHKHSLDVCQEGKQGFPKAVIAIVPTALARDHNAHRRAYP